MQKIIKLGEGKLLVPFAIHEKDIIIDTIKEINPDDKEYKKFLQEYERQEKIEIEIRAKLASNRSHSENKNE